MSVLFNPEAEIQRQRRENYRDKEQRLVIIGNGINGDPYADDQHVWVRDIGSKGESAYSSAGLPYKVLAGVGPTPEIDKHVWVEWQAGPREWKIVMSDPAFMDQTGRSMHLENPSDPHNQFVRTDRLLPLLSKSVGDGKVNVQGYQYVYDGVYRDYKGTSNESGTHVDLIALKPATSGHRCYAVLGYNYDLFAAGSNPIQTFVSTSQATDLDRTDIQECIEQMDLRISRPIWAYRVDNGWTAGDIVGHPDDRDLRFWPDVPSQTVITSDDASVTITQDGNTWDLSVASSGGMESFTVAGDSGTPFPIEDGNTLDLEGSGGITTAVDPMTKKVTISGSGITSGINQLTGDVTAGPGSGSQAATIANGAVTFPKMADGTPGSLIGYGDDGDPIEKTLTVYSGDGSLDITDFTTETGIVYDIRLLSLAVGVNDRTAQWGEAMVVNQLVFKSASDGKWYKADRDGAGPLMGHERGIVVGAGTGLANAFGTVRIYGPVSGFTGLTANAPVYLSTTAGGWTHTEPTPSLDGSAVMIARYGYATSTTEVFVDPRDPVIYRQYVTSSAGEETTITHHTDTLQLRRLVARTYVYDETSIQSYASSNQSADKPLQGYAGALVTVDNTGATLAALGNNGTNQFALAQSIAVTTGYVTQATVFFDANTGSPTGTTITVSLHADNGGVPAVAALESVSHTVTPSSNNTITFAGTTLVSGTIWLKLVAPVQASGVRYNARYNNANPYASGILKADSANNGGATATWATFGSTQDLRCSITTTATVYARLAQGFSHSSGANLVNVKLWLRKVGSPTGNLTAAIFSNTGGVPNAVITNGTSSTVSASTLGTSYAWVTFAFPVAPSISASTQYHIVLATTDSASNTNYVEWGIDTSSPSYANGVLTSDTSGTWSTASPAADGVFDVIAQGTQYEEDLQPGQWSGGVGQYGVRRASSTSTSFKNISGDDMPIIYDVIVP